MLTKLVLLLSAVLLMTGCSGAFSPTAPTQSSVNITGTWVDITGITILTVAQIGNSITGTFVAALANAAGTVSGTSAGNSVSLTFTPSDPRDCKSSLTLTVSGERRGGVLVGGTRMTGTMVLTNCLNTAGVPIEFIKQ
ncbi:hypothetical protein JYU09_00265 [bacterium AH-315-O15]|nr:hypothetical protein [bacterium AH-315-O15]